MSLLLTGHTGFLGQIIHNFLCQYIDVFTLSRSKGDFTFLLERDIPLFDRYFEVVVHNAGKAHTLPKTDIEKQAFYDINVNGTINLLKGLELNVLPKKFVFISSVAVYGLSNGTFINESSELSAKDPYGLSKIQAENLVNDWCMKHGVICTIFRLPLIAGQNPPGNLGAMIKGTRKGYYFNIAGGSAKKSMVLASDVAKYLLKASEIGGIFNLTDGYHPSFFELSENISRQLGKNRPNNLPLLLAKVSALIGDFFGAKAPLNSDKLCKITSDLTFDDTKAREAFGWDPTPVLEGFKISDKN